MSDLLSLHLPTGVTARGAHLDDVAAAVAVARAAEADEGLQALTLHDEIAADWARPSVDPTTDVLIVEEAATVIAYAEQHGGRAFAHVHPDHRGRGVGSAVAEWTERHARAAGLPRVGQTVPDRARHARALLEARGYEPRWEAWILRLDLATPPRQVRRPPGVTVRTMRRPADDRAVYDVIDTAFNTWPERDAMGFEDWRASFLDRAVDTDLVLLAEEAGRVVGTALCVPDGDEGWVDQLAVQPDAWGRGIGGLLLQTAFDAFRDRGLAAAALSTDSRTGALGLYEHVGMHVTESFTRHSLALTP